MSSGASPPGELADAAGRAQEEWAVLRLLLNAEWNARLLENELAKVFRRERIVMAFRRLREKKLMSWRYVRHRNRVHLMYAITFLGHDHLKGLEQCRPEPSDNRPALKPQYETPEGLPLGPKLRSLPAGRKESMGSGQPKTKSSSGPASSERQTESSRSRSDRD